MGKGPCLRERQAAKLNLTVGYSHSGQINEAMAILDALEQ
jgi:hypothetical protein